MMPPKLLPFLSYSHALTIATLSWLVSLSRWSANFRESKNSAARLVVRALPHVHIIPILGHLHWLPVRVWISYKTACFCFNAITSSTPVYLSDPLHLYSPSWSLCSSANIHLLKIPLYKCKTKGDCAFSYFGPSVWNSLPLHIRNATTIDTFRSALKTYLFTSKNLISSYLPDLPCVSVCVVCGVCVCVGMKRGREREGGRERGRERECAQQMWLCVDVLMYNV